jgi:hypothetical protein
LIEETESATFREDMFTRFPPIFKDERVESIPLRRRDSPT